MNPISRRVISLLIVLAICQPLNAAFAHEQPAKVAEAQIIGPTVPSELAAPRQPKLETARELSNPQAPPSPILQAQEEAAKAWVHANWDGTAADKKSLKFAANARAIQTKQALAEAISEDDTLPDRLRINGRRPRHISQEALAQPSFVSSEYTHITGTVRAGDTGLPISNVYVQAYDQRGYIEDYDQTDRQGHFRLIVPRGKYLIHYDAAEVYPYYFASEWYDNQASKATAQIITATGVLYEPPNEVDNIDATLDRGAQVSGTVLASDTGLPVANTKLVVYDDVGYIVNQIDVDDDGHYLSSGLASGQYHLCVYNPRPQTKYVVSCNPDETLKAYPTITVTAPDLLANVNISLSVGAQLSGVVSAIDTGLPLEDIGVYVYSLSGSIAAYTYTNSLGSYQLSGLPSGTYSMYFSTLFLHGSGGYYFSEFYNQKDGEQDADPITLLTSQTQQIDYALNRGAFILGRVTTKTTGDPLPDVEVNAIGMRDGIRTSYYGNWAYTDDQGYYRLTVRPGTYTLAYNTHYSAKGKNYCSQYWDGSASLNGNAIITATRNTTQTIDVALAPAGGMSGRLTASDTGLAVHPTNVYAWFSGSTPSDFDDRLRVFAQTNQNGQYNIAGLCGSDYKLGFYPPLPYAWAYYNHELRYDHATIVPNTRGFTTQIDSTLDPAGLITGVVRSDRDGNPVEGAIVAAVAALGRLDNIFFGSVLTDDQGRYQLWLPATNYRLVFYTTPDYCEHYNAGVTTLAQAPLLLLRPGEYLPNNNAILTRAVVTGTVYAKESGLPLPSVFVYDVPLDPQGGSADSTYTNSAGQFALYGLCRGRHTIGFTPTSFFSPTNQYAKQYYGGHLTKETADVLTITNATTQVVQAKLDIGVVVSGQIQYGDVDVDYTGPVIAIYDENGDYVTSQFADYDGRFLLRLPRGRLKLSAFDYYSSKLANQFFDHKNDLDSADIVDTRATDIITGLNFLIGSGNVIRGTVIDADTGLPVQYGIVSVYDANHENYLAYIASINSQGMFTTTASLPAGQYKLKVSGWGYVPSYYGNTKDFASADVITVSNGITTNAVQIAALSLLSPQNTVFRVYMPVVPHTPAPLLVRVPTHTPTPTIPPTATPTSIPTRVEFVTPAVTPSRIPITTIVFSGTFPSGTTGRSVLLSNSIVIADVKVKGDPSFNEGDEYIDIRNNSDLQSVTMIHWKIRINNGATFFIPNEVSSASFSIPPQQGCRIYTGSVASQNTPPPYNWCGAQSLGSLAASAGAYTNDHGLIELLDEANTTVAYFEY